MNYLLVLVSFNLLLLIIIKLWTIQKNKKYDEIVSYLDESITPGDVSYILTGKYTIDGFRASILNLIDKENIREYKNKKDQVYYKSFKKTKKDSDELLVHFLIRTIGNNKKVYLWQIIEYFENEKQADIINMFYHVWVSMKKKERPIKLFFTKTKIIFTNIGIILFLLNFLFFVYYISNFFINEHLSLALEFQFWFNILLIILSTAFSVFVINYIYEADRYNKEGINLFNQWNGFKNFLLSLETIDDKKIKHQILWREYLVYAVATGVADSIEEQLGEDDFYFTISKYIEGVMLSRQIFLNKTFNRFTNLENENFD